jgi:hypothetical protein
MEPQPLRPRDLTLRPGQDVVGPVSAPCNPQRLVARAINAKDVGRRPGRCHLSHVTDTGTYWWCATQYALPQPVHDAGHPDPLGIDTFQMVGVDFGLTTKESASVDEDGWRTRQT